MYRVCGDEGCYQSDSVAAVEQAILDEVDSINFSISGGTNPYSDIVEQAFSVAYENGVFVSASAGNAGPGADTVAHRGPWTMTVGASTTDRHFLSTVSLESGNGDTLTLEGASVTDGISTPTDVVLASDYGDGLCLNPFPSGTFNGEIVVCERGIIARVEKSYNVGAGGAGGMLLYNPVLQGLATDNHFIPSVHLENDAGTTLLDFLSTHTGVTATFTQGTATMVQGDKMAAFSSRGGPGQPLGVSKPDITAPGVQILAGHTPLPATVVGGLPGQLFQSIQGTSMSSPHIAGSAALVKDLHPDWTPGQIKSALMMTALTGGVTKEDDTTPADPFDYGSGRVDLSLAGTAGVTISDSTANFYALEDELWNSNYPSLYVPVMPGQITVQRTLHSEIGKNSLWMLSVDSPADMSVSVPQTVNVKAGQDATFDITVDARRVPLGEVRHATVYLTHKGQVLHFPITIVRSQPAVTLEKTCDPATVIQGETTDCTITIENTSFDEATVSLFDKTPPGLPLVEGSVVGADQNGAASLSFDGTLFGAGAPVVDVTPGALFGYLPLSAFGIAPFPCPSNCDDGGLVITGLNIDYLGQHYTSAIWSVNGTLELGTASGVASSFANQNLPDSAIPNNVLAPWWTDLNLGAGGNWYLGTLTDGVSFWDIFEWEGVPRFGDNSSTFSFQIWLEQGTDNIHFTYGSFSGNTGDGTTGAENADGTVGDTEYFDGAGTLPWGGPDLQVASVPGTPGGKHTITYSALGAGLGPWTNCAEMSSDLYQGLNVACFNGETIQ
jgi:subtilisin family serine protease